MVEPKKTIPTQLVLEALFADPQRELCGLEIGEAAGLRYGTWTRARRLPAARLERWSS